MKDIMRLALGALAALGMSGAALAQQSNPHHQMAPEQHQKMMADKPVDASVIHAEGVIKSVDASNQTVTIAHDPIAAKKWPAMTMTFKAEKGVLRPIKAGQRVIFCFRDEGSSQVITKMTPQ